MFILMTALTMMAGLFAYEPNPELFEVSYDKLDRCRISYYEEVEPQSFFKGERLIVILNAKNDNIKRDAIFHYEQYDAIRKACLITLGLYTNDKVRYDVKCSDEQIAKAKEYKNQAINKVPFITEENFDNITEKQYVRKFTKYMKKIKKQNKNK